MHNIPGFSNNYLNESFLEQLQLEAAQRQSVQDVAAIQQQNALPGVSSEHVLEQSQLERAIEESKAQAAFEKATRDSVVEAKETDNRMLRKGMEKSTVALARQASLVTHAEDLFRKACRKNETQTAKDASLVTKGNEDMQKAIEMSALDELAEIFARNQKVGALLEAVSFFVDMGKIITDLLKVLMSQFQAPEIAPIVPVDAPVAPQSVQVDVEDIVPFPIILPPVAEPLFDEIPIIIGGAVYDQPIAVHDQPIVVHDQPIAIHDQPIASTASKISKAAPGWLRALDKKTKPHYGEPGSNAERIVKDATVRTYFSTLRGTLDRSKGKASLKNTSERYLTVAHGMHRHLKDNKTIYGEPITTVMLDKLAKLPLNQLVWLYLVTEHEAATYGRDEHWDQLSKYMKEQIWLNFQNKDGDAQRDLVECLARLKHSDFEGMIKACDSYLHQ